MIDCLNAEITRLIKCVVAVLIVSIDFVLETA